MAELMEELQFDFAERKPEEGEARDQEDWQQKMATQAAKKKQEKGRK